MNQQNRHNVTFCSLSLCSFFFSMLISLADVCQNGRSVIVWDRGFGSSEDAHSLIPPWNRNSGSLFTMNETDTNKSVTENCQVCKSLRILQRKCLCTYTELRLFRSLCKTRNLKDYHSHWQTIHENFNGWNKNRWQRIKPMKKKNRACIDFFETPGIS